MSETVPDKNVEIEGRVIGANSTLKLSLKTAFWLVTTVFALVMGILTYSYFDLKSDVNSSQKEFIENVDVKIEKMDGNVQQIRIDQATIKGDIKLILDRQNRENPVVANPNISVQPAVPPAATNSVIDTTGSFYMGFKEK